MNHHFFFTLFFTRQSLGPAPLSQRDEQVWEEKVVKMEKKAVGINKRIERLTLMRAIKQHSSASTQVTNYGIGQ